YTTLNGPLTISLTHAQGINAAGQVVGWYANASGTHGFLYSGGTYTTLDNPLPTSGTFAYGINDAGQIVGTYQDSSGRYHGFLYSNGTYVTLDDPLAAPSGSSSGTFAYGINNSGQIVGQNFNTPGRHAFLAPLGPTPPPSTGTTADMILRGSNISPGVAGQYEIYDIGNSTILAAYSLGRVGTDWGFVTLGGF